MTDERERLLEAAASILLELDKQTPEQPDEVRLYRLDWLRTFTPAWLQEYARVHGVWKTERLYCVECQHLIDKRAYVVRDGLIYHVTCHPGKPRRYG